MPSEKKTARVPSYRRHRPTGQAVVTLNGHDIYLGKWNTKASKAESDRLIAEWLAGGRCLPPDDKDLTVLELALAYWRFAKSYYRKNGEPTSTLDGVRQSLRRLRQLYGSVPASSFGPRSLTALREVLLEFGCLNRNTINKRIGTVKRMFRWAVAHELVPAHVWHGLQAVSGLRKGRTNAPESEPTQPVADQVVEATALIVTL